MPDTLDIKAVANGTSEVPDREAGVEGTEMDIVLGRKILETMAGAAEGEEGLLDPVVVAHDPGQLEELLYPVELYRLSMNHSQARVD
jgi:hypothetical protein